MYPKFYAKMKKWLFLVLFFWVATGSGFANSDGIDDGVCKLRNGDLLFQDLDCGPMCDAIDEVTMGYHGAKLSHVGIFWQRSDSSFVIEAISRGVVVTPLKNFLSRSCDLSGCPKVIVGRLKPRYKSLIPGAIKEALRLKGKPYDDFFRIDNDAYYCSELVYFAFLKANGDKPLFPLAPMTYKSPKTGEYYPVWIEYFKKLRVPIPQGKPGLNPGGISRSSALCIYEFFGRPSGITR